MYFPIIPMQLQGYVTAAMALGKAATTMGKVTMALGRPPEYCLRYAFWSGIQF